MLSYITERPIAHFSSLFCCFLVIFLFDGLSSNELHRLKDLLRAKLIECGWRDELKNYCKEVIKNKGLEKITVEELVAEITPRGRATVPSAIKAELLQRIRKFLTQN